MNVHCALQYWSEKDYKIYYKQNSDPLRSCFSFSFWKLDNLSLFTSGEDPALFSPDPYHTCNNDFSFWATYFWKSIKKIKFRRNFYNFMKNIRWFINNSIAYQPNILFLLWIKGGSRLLLSRAGSNLRILTTHCSLKIKLMLLSSFEDPYLFLKHVFLVPVSFILSLLCIILIISLFCIIIIALI